MIKGSHHSADARAKIGAKSKGRIHSAEALAKMSRAHAGRQYRLGIPHTAETRAKMSATRKGCKGHPCSAETRAKLSASAMGHTRNTGVPRTAETRARISAATKGKTLGKPKTAAHCANISAGRMGIGKGIPHSAEHRAKHSAAMKGRVVSAETRAKLSAAHKGRVNSAEARAKISAAVKLAYLDGRIKSKLGSKWSPEASARHRAQMKADFASGRRTFKPDEAKRIEGLRRAHAEGRVSLPHVVRYTKLAQALHAHLTSTGLTLEPEIRFGRYTVDLYDRAHHIAYEADGAYWHEKNERERPGYYAQRDEYLIRYFGLKVVHFTDKEISALTGWPNKKKASA